MNAFKDAKHLFQDYGYYARLSFTGQQYIYTCNNAYADVFQTDFEAQKKSRGILEGEITSATKIPTTSLVLFSHSLYNSKW